MWWMDLSTMAALQPFQSTKIRPIFNYITPVKKMITFLVDIFEEVWIMKAELSLLTPWRYIICRWSGGITPLNLNLSTRWRWVVKLTSWLFYSHKRAPVPNWTEGWTGPKWQSGRFRRKKISCPCQDLKPRPSNWQPSCYINCTNLAHLKKSVCMYRIQTWFNKQDISAIMRSH